MATFGSLTETGSQLEMVMRPITEYFWIRLDYQKSSFDLRVRFIIQDGDFRLTKAHRKSTGNNLGDLSFWVFLGLAQAA